MALKSVEGHYLRVAVMEGVNLDHGIAYIRIYEHHSEEERIANPHSPDKNYCVQEIKLTAKEIDDLQKLSYKLVKNHTVKVGEEKFPAETEDVAAILDGEGNIIAPAHTIITKEAYSEDIFDSPYLDMVDC